METKWKTLKKKDGKNNWSRILERGGFLLVAEKDPNGFYEVSLSLDGQLIHAKFASSVIDAKLGIKQIQSWAQNNEARIERRVENLRGY